MTASPPGGDPSAETDFVRLAGRADVSGGDLVWTVADGRRGRRWRWIERAGGGVVRSVLVELSPAGRTSRLEVAAAAGLLTLHPEPDEASIHGNLVTADGVRHLALPWSPDHWLLVRPDLFAAELPRALRPRLEIGTRHDGRALVVGPDLELESIAFTIRRVDAHRWAFDGAAGLGLPAEVEPDERGLPWPAADGVAETWPLELD